jgi:hypothetical protein
MFILIPIGLLLSVRRATRLVACSRPCMLSACILPAGISNGVRSGLGCADVIAIVKAHTGIDGDTKVTSEILDYGWREHY